MYNLFSYVELCSVKKISRFYCVLLLKKKGRMDVRIGILSEAFCYMCI